MTKLCNIIYETDGVAVDLPTKIDAPDHITEDEMADFISDQTGWLVLSFDIK